MTKALLALTASLPLFLVPIPAQSQNDPSLQLTVKYIDGKLARVAIETKYAHIFGQSAKLEGRTLCIAATETQYLRYLGRDDQTWRSVNCVRLDALSLDGIRTDSAEEMAYNDGSSVIISVVCQLGAHCVEWMTARDGGALLPGPGQGTGLDMWVRKEDSDSIVKAIRHLLELGGAKKAAPDPFK